MEDFEKLLKTAIDTLKDHPDINTVKVYETSRAGVVLSRAPIVYINNVGNWTWVPDANYIGGG